MTMVDNYTWQDIDNAVDNIIIKMYKDKWVPDYIVGITRGGLVPALLLSHKLSIPMHTLRVQLRDGDCELNGWMPEDAIGYVHENERSTLKSRWDIKKRKNILIVDDINDTGATFNYIKRDWQSGCFPSEVDTWNSVWNHNVRFAVISENLSSDFQNVDYYYNEINKAENDIWVKFPWESY